MNLTQLQFKNQAPFTNFQAFLLNEIISLYQQMNHAASLNDFTLAFGFLGELEDTEARALDAGLSRQQITFFVELQFAKELRGDVA